MTSARSRGCHDLATTSTRPQGRCDLRGGVAIPQRCCGYREGRTTIPWVVAGMGVLATPWSHRGYHDAPATPQRSPRDRSNLHDTTEVAMTPWRSPQDRDNHRNPTYPWPYRPWPYRVVAVRCDVDVGMRRCRRITATFATPWICDPTELLRRHAVPVLVPILDGGRNNKFCP